MAVGGQQGPGIRGSCRRPWGTQVTTTHPGYTCALHDPAPLDLLPRTAEAAAAPSNAPFTLPHMPVRINTRRTPSYTLSVAPPHPHDLLQLVLPRRGF